MSARAAAVAVALAVAFAAPHARAIDPARAERDAAEILSKQDAFCKSPARPMSKRGLATCPIAGELPACDGLRAACEEERLLKERRRADGKSRWLSDPLRAQLVAVGRVLIWVLLVGVVLALFVPLIAIFLRRRRERALAEPRATEASTRTGAAKPMEAPLSDEDPEVLLRRAAELEHRGEYEPALFTYLNAALRALDVRGAIRIARHRTNGEYVRGCREPEAREPLASLVHDVDRVQFGGAMANAETAARASSRAAALVRRASAAATIVLGLLTGGCELAFHDAKPASDPGGDDVFVALLRAQGVDVSSLPSSLASLPVPGPREIAPAVLVNTDRTILEVTTEGRLMEWVQAGGVLILAGSPMNWPAEIGAIAVASESTEIEAMTDPDPDFDAYDDDGDDEPERDRPPPSPPRVARGRGIVPAALHFGDGAFVPLAHTGDGKRYAAQRAMKRGEVIALASSDLFTNAELARPGNPETLLTILRPTSGRALRIARDEDGITPVTNPLTALERAGLGLSLYHALAATLVLYAAVGLRLTRPRRTTRRERRAFTEHVEANGNLYRRAGASAHALAAYARYAEERVRQRMPRGAHDPAAWLAQRSGASHEECARLWERATRAAAEPARGLAEGDELRALKRLSAIVSSALRLGRGGGAA